jgi:hypothetical protein
LARKKVDAPASASADAASARDDDFVTLDVAVSRIIGEMTESRIRQRALLESLRQGDFSWERYLRIVHEIRNRDFDPLFASMVLKNEVFSERFRDWVKEDAARYMFQIGGSDQAAGKTPGGSSRPRPRKEPVTQPKRKK